MTSNTRYIAAPYKPRIKHNRVYASCYFKTLHDPGADALNECLALCLYVNANVC